MQDETSSEEPIALIERLKKEDENSETLSGNPKSRSVYDFFYHDARRVASFLAQFVEHGVPGSIKTASGADEASTARKSASGGGSLFGFAQAQAAIDRSVTGTQRDSTEKQYDPFWNNAIRFLEYVDDERILHRDVLTSRLGQVVLVSGPLILIDPIILKDLYGEAFFKAQVRASSAIQNMSSKTSLGKEHNKQVDFLMSVLSKMPHTIQAHMLPQTYSIWASLNVESMVTSSSDVMLKNGALVAGIWNMVGIIDAFPSHRLLPGSDGQVPDFDKIIQDRMSAPVTQIMSALAPVIRQAVGRPDDYYGITPLIIFREVGPGQ